MKKGDKKGFTLVELLAVIVILVIIALIALPNFSSSIERNEEKQNQKIEKVVLSTGELYIQDNYDDVNVDDASYCYFKVNELVANNFIPGDDISDYKNGCVIFNKSSNEYYVTDKEKSDGSSCQVDEISTSKRCLNVNDSGRLSLIKLDVSVSEAKKYSKNKTAKITVEDNSGSGLKEENVNIYYAWGTSAVSCFSSMSSFTTLEPTNGAKSITEKVIIDGGTGAGKLYVCNKDSAIYNTLGDSLAQGTIDSVDMYLDNTKPTIDNTYVASNIFPSKSYSTPNNLTVDENVLTTTGNDPYLPYYNLSITNIKKVIITFGTPVAEDFTLQIFWAVNNGGFVNTQQTKGINISKDSTFVVVDLTNDDNYDVTARPTNVTLTGIRFDFGDSVNKTFNVTGIDFIGDDATEDKYIYADLKDEHSKVVAYAITSTNSAPSNWTSIASVNEYSMRAKIVQLGTNYIWTKDSAENTSSVSIVATIDTIKPTDTLCASKTYNGSAQQLTSVTDSNGYTLSGYSQTNAGTHTITAKLKTGYVWSDGSTDDVTFQCIMNKKDVTVTAGTSTKVYDGSVLTDSTCSANGLVSGHTVSCTMSSDSAITNVGSVDNVISVVAIKNGDNEVDGNYSVTTANGKLTITSAILSEGSVVITGNNTVGSTLTASVTNTTPIANYAYQWYTNTSNATTGGTAISGAISSTFTLTSSQVGKYIYVIVTATKDNYSSKTFSDITDTTNNKLAVTKIVTEIPTATNYCKSRLVYNGSAQTLTNTASTGYTLSGNTGTNAGSYTVVATLSTNYVWSDFATSTKTFSCSIGKTSIAYTLNITGNNVVGQTLTATISSASPSDSTYTYQWYTNTSNATSGGIAISGATSSTFTLTSAQVGKYIYCQVVGNPSATNATNYSTLTKNDVTDDINNKTAIVKTMVTIPTADNYCKSGLTYTGSSQTLTNTAATGYTFSGNTGTNVGSYTVTATLSTNYVWSDFTTGTKSFSCSISYKTYTVTLNNLSADLVAGTAILYGRYADGIYLDSSYTKKMTTSANAITVPTRTKYVFEGYFTNIGGTGTQMITEDGYITSNLTNIVYDSNVTLYAYWTEAAYKIDDSTGTKYVRNLGEAVSKVSTGGTMLALKNNSSGAVTVSKNLTLNTGGYTITQIGAITISSGSTLSILGTGTLTSSAVNNLINNGTLNITNGNVVNTSSTYSISNYGTLTLDGTSVKITTTSTSIKNYKGTLTIDGAVIESTDGNGISGNAEGATLIFNSGTLTASTGTAIWLGSNDTVFVYSGTITGVNAICSSAGIVNVSGGTLTGEGTSSEGNSIIASGGSVTISGGTFGSITKVLALSNSIVANITGGTYSCTQTNCEGIYISSGTLNLDGGTFYSPIALNTNGGTVNYGKNTTPSITAKTTGLYVNSGTLNILKGTLTCGGDCIYGVAGTINIGSNDGTIYTDTIKIYSGNYSVNNNGSTFNFYDGILYGKYNPTYTGTVSSIPSGYAAYAASSDTIGYNYMTYLVDDSRTTFNLWFADYEVVDGTAGWVSGYKLNDEYSLDGSNYAFVCNSDDCTDVSSCTESDIEDCESGASDWIGSFSQISWEAPASSTVYAWYTNESTYFNQSSWIQLSLETPQNVSYRFTGDRYNVLYIRVDYNNLSTVFRIFLKLDYTAPSISLPEGTGTTWYNFNPSYTLPITYTDNESGLASSVSAFIERKDSCSFDHNTNTTDGCSDKLNCCISNSLLTYSGEAEKTRNTNCTDESSCKSTYNNLWSCVQDMVGNSVCVYKNNPTATQYYGSVYYKNTH